MPRWWNWQTRYLEVVVSVKACAGSSPVLGTIYSTNPEMNKVYTDIDGNFKFEGYHVSDRSFLESKEFRRVMALVKFNGKIVIIRDKSGWGLPGGSREEGETVSDAIIRELMEEADVTVSSQSLVPVAVMKAFMKEGEEWSYVEDQMILYCEIDVLSDSTPDPDEDIIERRVVEVDELGEYIKWPESIPWMQSWIKNRP